MVGLVFDDEVVECPFYKVVLAVRLVGDGWD